MAKFREKPVEVEATQWFKNGDHPKDHEAFGDTEGSDIAKQRYEDYLQTEGKVVRRCRIPDRPGADKCKKCKKTMHEHGWIDTLEGGHIVCPGDWIITGIQGEHYPCKPKIFEATYEKVRQCRECGCTDDDCSGCIDRTGEACYWTEWDLCSACYATSQIKKGV